MPLYLTERDVALLLTAEDAIAAVDGSLRRRASGIVDSPPRVRLALEGGQFAVMPCVDRALGYAGVKAYAWTPAGTPFVLLLFGLVDVELAAVIEADTLGQLRTGAASAVAALQLAREGASSLGVIGCGRQAAAHVACIRAALPQIERVVVSGRDRARLTEFCRVTGSEAAESNQEAAACDIVVTATTSRDPVLRGDWLAEGSLVCAVGANDPSERELDNGVLERAAFVCCDSRDQARLEAGDLIEPVASGVLDWLEVHELGDVVTGEVTGRAAASDIVVFKSNGLAAWDVAAGARAVALAVERGVGRAI